MVIHSETNNSNVSLAQEFKRHLSNAKWKHGLIGQVKYTLCSIKSG